MKDCNCLKGINIRICSSIYDLNLINKLSKLNLFKLFLQVVDARAGPGTKSMNKIRKSREESILMRKHKHKKFLRSRRNSQGDLSDDGGIKPNLFL